MRCAVFWKDYSSSHYSTIGIAIKFAIAYGDKTGGSRFCRFRGSNKLRTIAYVDGYNLYYGRLSNTPYKWLDLKKLIAEILRVQNPVYELLEVKYFTSPVLARLASRGQESQEAQARYIRALEATGVKVILGRHQLEPGSAPAYFADQAPDRTKRVAIWNLNEKETDVRLALELYRDASQRRLEQTVVVSSDTDIGPMLEALRRDFSMPIGLVLPRDPLHNRPPSGTLMNNADWTRSHILDEELAASLLPDRIPTRKKPIVKPSYW